MITIKDGEVDIGANASAEEQQEALEDGATTVNNIVHSFRLQSTSFDKKSYMTYIKDYLKTIKAKLQETNPERIPAFEKGAQTFVKKVRLVLLLFFIREVITDCRLFFTIIRCWATSRTTNSTLANRWTRPVRRARAKRESCREH